MVVGYSGRKIIMENNDTSYYGRILIKALATHYPNNYYILYSPQNEHNKRMTALFNEDSVRIKFPRSHIHSGTVEQLRQQGTLVYRPRHRQGRQGPWRQHLPWY